MKPILFAICLIFCFHNEAIAQERKILGQVLSRETKKPIKNAHLIIFGTQEGTSSNARGFFELVIKNPNQKVLIASHVGFKNVNVPIPVENQFMFYMEKDQIQLDPLFLNTYPKNPINLEPQRTANTPVEGAFRVVESGAVFPGGMPKFYTHLGNGLSTLSTKPRNGFRISFTINAQGKAENVVFSDTTSLPVGEILRVFQEMPAWTAATQDQESVPQDFILWVSLGRSEVYKFISENIHYPVEARRMGIEGSVWAQFEVQNRKLASFILLKDAGGKCGEEVKRVLSLVPEELLELLGNGAYILPVNFGLDQNFEDNSTPAVTNQVLLSPIYLTAQGIHQDIKVGPGGRTSSQRLIIERDVGSTSLESALKDPKTVKKISLVNQGLEVLPPEIGQLRNLMAVDLERNRLMTLPVELTTLKQLKELYAFDNEIEALPAGFSQLSNLLVLGFARNRLANIPNEILQLPKLEALDLGDNGITSIPPEIAKLKKLRVLSLKGNAIRTLPVEFYALTKLEQIDLSGNPISAEEIELVRKSLSKAVVIF